MKNFSLFNTKSGNAPMTRGVAVSSTNTYYSAKISESWELSFTLSWTGTPTGVLTVWGSDVDQPNEANDADWFSITASPAPANPAGGAASTHGAVNDVNCKWKRVKYVNASGSGVLSGDASRGENA